MLHIKLCLSFSVQFYYNSILADLSVLQKIPVSIENKEIYIYSSSSSSSNPFFKLLEKSNFRESNKDQQMKNMHHEIKAYKKLQYKTSLVLVCGTVPVSSAAEAVEPSTVVKSKGGKYSEPSMFCFSVDQEVD